MLSKREYSAYALKYLREWEKKLNSFEALTIAKQVREWDRISNSFNDLIIKLSKKQNLTPNQLFRLEEYKKFLTQAKDISQQYATFNANLIANGQGAFAKVGLTTSNKLLSLIDVNFNSDISIEAVNKMIGYTADGSPLYKVLLKRFDENITKASNLLENGIAQGSNPNRIAQLMTQSMDVSRYNAARIARTEMSRVYSSVSFDNYKQSGIVKSYDRIEQPDCCPECADVVSGNPYDIDDKSAIDPIHPFCRGTVSPHL